MNSIDWSKTLIHCSSLGKLTTEPQSKEAKLNGDLSATAKTHLIAIYAEEMYKFRKELDTKEINKGKMVEQESIDIMSIVTKIPLEKNETVFSNDYFVGTPDCIYNDLRLVFDAKSSYDWLTFLDNIPSKLDSTYEAQVNGYLDLLGFDTGYIAYVLNDTPESIRNGEKYNLLRKMDVISEDSPAFVREWEEKERQMIFSNTHYSERILMFKVEKDEEYLEKARQKVWKARQFLQDFHEKHKNFNNNFVF